MTAAFTARMIAVRSRAARASLLQYVEYAVDLIVRQARVDGKAEHLLCDSSGDREARARRRRQTAVHRKIADERIEIAAHPDVFVAEFPVQRIAAERIARLDEDRE